MTEQRRDLGPYCNATYIITFLFVVYRLRFWSEKGLARGCGFLCLSYDMFPLFIIWHVSSVYHITCFLCLSYNLSAAFIPPSYQTTHVLNHEHTLPQTWQVVVHHPSLLLLLWDNQRTYSRFKTTFVFPLDTTQTLMWRLSGWKWEICHAEPDKDTFVFSSIHLWQREKTKAESDRTRGRRVMKTHRDRGEWQIQRILVPLEDKQWTDTRSERGRSEYLSTASAKHQCSWAASHSQWIESVRKSLALLAVDVGVLPVGGG